MGVFNFLCVRFLHEVRNVHILESTRVPRCLSSLRSIGSLLLPASLVNNDQAIHTLLLWLDSVDSGLMVEI